MNLVEILRNILRKRRFFICDLNPIELFGRWEEGYALDYHTISSELICYNDSCRKIYDTKRTKLGQLLYRLKYNSERRVLKKLSNISVEFLRDKWQITSKIEGIIPIPPSNERRILQPVTELTKKLASRLKINLLENSLIKTKKTPELKDIFEYSKREKILYDALTIDDSLITGKSVLIIDDIYRSGATLNVATDLLYKYGMVDKVYVFVLTKTRNLK